MNEPLKPCHCNTTPILQHTPETGFYIHCPTCQSYTHGIEWSREEALAVWNNRVDPWVRIDPERPETLPPIGEDGITSDIILLSLRDIETGEEGVIGAWYDREFPPLFWNSGDGDRIVYRMLSGKAIAVAWQPLPEPAVYEESE